MNYIKRALLSISRKKSKSLLLFLIIFVLGNVMAGAIAIRQGADNVERNIKQQLGAVLTIDADYEAYQKAQEENPDNPVMIEPLKPELLQTIGQSSYVKSYDYTTQMGMGSEHLESWIDPQQMEWMGNDPYRKYYGFTLKGTQYPPVMIIEEGKANLVAGKTFTQDDINNGAGVVLMSKQLAELNNLSVGSNIVVSNYILDWQQAGPNPEPKVLEQRDLPLTIIGIYEQVEPPETNNNRGYNPNQDKQQIYNTLIVPNQTILAEQRFMNEYYINQSDYEMTEEEKERAMQTYYQSLFILNNPDDIAAFKQETEPLLPQFTKIITNSDSFSVIAAPVEQTSKMANYVLLVAIGASILIISLVVMLFLRDRKHELGIYMSLGEKRTKVISQIVFEVMLVALLAIALSLVTGNLIAQNLSDSMVRDQLVAESDPMNPAPEFWEDQWRFGQFASNLTSEQIAENYRINFTPAYIGLFILIGLGTVLVSTVVPMLYIVRLNPKQVLM